MPTPLKRHTLLVIGYLAAAVVLAVVAGALTDWKRSYYLTKQGQRTIGWITAKEPANHRALRYQYQVGSHTYQGVETRSEVKAGDRFDLIHIGDPVEVVFVPTEPEISCACDPATLLRSDILFITMIALLGPVAILVLNFLVKRSRRG